MAATLTRRALRRARLGGRHAYRTANRHRAALAIAATFAVFTVGSGVAAVHDGPPTFGPPGFSHPQMMHGPMPWALPDHPGGPRR
jgi:hypothetical protein